MAVRPEGTPCWADAMFDDADAAKRFYGDVLGWTFAEPDPRFGDYAQAYADGKAVAAVSPTMPGMEGGAGAWCLYLASPDLDATAQKVRDAGGEVLMGPMDVGDFGGMLLVRDPGGVVFGVWRAGTHQGFDAEAVPGAYCWAEVYTREAPAADTFFSRVFPYRVRHVEDTGGMDFNVYALGEDAVLGRMKMNAADFPPEVPSYLNVYFTVPDCDDAVARVTESGGRLHFGPVDTPFGRFASLGDPQGAAFSVIDITTTEGEMPKITDVS
ncbi:VOC family protein [Streptomyces sp. RKND-216]|uniref:VOC family protein n=1 Tax=Streptomyces sp. RKND-216 TaxID=2562581 RepID=UPI00109E0B05|nr:VOC family protein [Streptomyces sp. RKND-216]THA25629.1 VOC family protein [Streptomyces sp. RKND-216]